MRNPGLQSTRRFVDNKCIYTQEKMHWSQFFGYWVSVDSVPLLQGLGTSTSEEGKTYFKDIKNHMKEFVWEDEQDGDLIELAFSKKKIDARKNWLRQFEVKTKSNLELK